MRMHFHTYGHSYGGSDLGTPAPPPQWMSSVPPLRYIWLTGGNGEGFLAVIVLAAFLLTLLVRFLWRVAGLLTGTAER